MKNYWLVALVLLGVAACSPAKVEGSKLTGAWRLASHGRGIEAEGVNSGGVISFNSDGSFEAKGVPSLVHKGGGQPGVMLGTWRIGPSDTSGIDPRSSVILRDRGRNIDIVAKYSEPRGRGTLTFSRDEEAGNWVKYVRDNN